MAKTKWEYTDWGVKAELARRAGILPPNLARILQRKANPGIQICRKLEKAAKSMGLRVSRFDFIENDITDNPLFSPIDI
jgi:transcriptional regulator with XRE-family HTH domain